MIAMKIVVMGGAGRAGANVVERLPLRHLEHGIAARARYAQGWSRLQFLQVTRCIHAQPDRIAEQRFLLLGIQERPQGGDVLRAIPAHPALGR